MSGTDAEAIRAAARTALAANGVAAGTSPVSGDRSAWRRLATELGLPGLGVPERLGGLGADLLTELIVHEEFGRSLSTAPYLATAGFVLPALLEVAGAADGLIEQILAGEVLVAPAYGLDSPSTPAPIRVAADASLSGAAEPVLDGATADRALVAAEVDGTLALLQLDLADPGTTRGRCEALDLTREFARLAFADVPAQVVARGAGAVAALTAARRHAALALAADSVGLAARILELSVDYVKVRVQFGRPIGSFQAVKHRCADMYLRLEAARSALLLAADAVQSGSRDLEPAVALARAVCGESAFWIANECLHLFGGIGYTWEHPAHLYLRRAKTNQLLLDPGYRQRAVAAAAVARSLRQEVA